MFNSLKRFNNTEIEHDPEKTVIYWYTCGPTVYDKSHIGHARTYVTDDIMKSVFRFMGYRVYDVMNVTDIDDKIINKAKAEGVPFTEVSKKYGEEFFADMKTLGVNPTTKVTYVSQYIDKIITFIQRIIDNDLAYVSNGSVYLDMNSYYEAGHKDLLFDTSKLAPNANTRLDEEIKSEKRDYRDFALWKASHEGEPSWESPFGPGRPAWHIECSAMIYDTLFDPLMDPFDRPRPEVMGDRDRLFTVHTGGEDLTFPHHENEMKQFVAHGTGTSDDPVIAAFMHYGRLNINGVKMSKSEKNYVTIRDVLSEISPNVLRTLFLLHNWNDQLEFSAGSMEYARSTYDKLTNYAKHIKAMQGSSRESITEKDHTIADIVIHTTDEFHKTLKTTVNISNAFNLVIDLIDGTNEYVLDSPNGGVLNGLLELFTDMMSAFNFDMDDLLGTKGDSNADEVIDVLVKIRDELRMMGKSKTFNKGQLFALTDKIRDVIAPDLGIVIEDKGKDPSIWYRK